MIDQNGELAFKQLIVDAILVSKPVLPAEFPHAEHPLRTIKSMAGFLPIIVYAIVATLGILMAALSERRIRLLGVILSLAALMGVIVFAFEKTLERDQLQEIIHRSEERAKWAAEAWSKPSKTMEFIDGIPVIHSTAEGNYHSGGRVILFGIADEDDKEGSIIALEAGARVEVVKGVFHWHSDEIGKIKIIRAVGLVNYYMNDNPEIASKSEGLTLNLESFEVIPEVSGAQTAAKGAN